MGLRLLACAGLAAIADEHTLKPLRGRRFGGILSIAK